MQGLFINGSRPRTKKQVKEQLARINNHLKDPETYPQGHPEAEDPYSVVIEATSMFGNEFDGSLAKAMKCQDRDCPKADPDGDEMDTGALLTPHQHLGPFYLVGPDPYRNRQWYAKLEYVITDKDPARDNPQGEWRLS